MLLVRPERNPSPVKELQELPERDGGVFRSPRGAALASLIPGRGSVEEDLTHASLQRPPNHGGPIDAFPLCEEIKASKGLVVQPDGGDGHSNTIEYIVFIPMPGREGWFDEGEST